MRIGSDKWKTLIDRGADQLGITLEPPALEQLAVHARELIQWNEKINLTAVTDPTEIAVKHILDSLAAGVAVPAAGTLLDVGTGAGFPGIPLKILRPSLCVTLIDASRKKVTFVKHVVRLLGLQNMDVRHLRADDLARSMRPKDPLHRADTRSSAGTPAPFDTVVSRALSSLDAFVGLSLPLIVGNGRIIALKGRITDSELDGARQRLRDEMRARGSETDAWHISVSRFKLPLLGAHRSLVTIQLGGVSRRGAGL